MPLGILSDEEFQRELDKCIPNGGNSIGSDTDSDSDSRQRIVNNDDSTSTGQTIGQTDDSTRQKDDSRQSDRNTIARAPILPFRSDPLYSAPHLLEPTENPTEKSSHGRNKGDTNTPQAVREIVGELALRGVNPKNIVEAFNVSPSSISAYKVGATSTSSYHNPQEELLEKTNFVRDKIAQRAQQKLMAALSTITKDRIQSAKLKDASRIASDMANIVNKMQPRPSTNININNEKTDVKYVFFTPRVRKEEDYEIIDVSNSD